MRYFLILLSIVFVFSCIPYSDNPLTTPDKNQLDSSKPAQWTDKELLSLTDALRRISKPMIIAFNKCDKAPDELMKKMKEIKDYSVVPTSAESELALTNATEKQLINYTPGSNTYSITDEEKISSQQRKALDYIKTHVLEKYGSTLLCCLRCW